MNLKVQLISLFFSFFYGICFYVITRLNHKFLFHGKKTSRIIFTLIYIIDFSLLYFIIISKINSGILHIYFLLSFVLGFFVTKLFLGKKMWLNIVKWLYFFIFLLYLLFSSIIMYGVMVGDNDLPKKRRKVKKKKLRLLLLGCTSIFIIGLTTFTIGKSWVEIYDKYKEKKQLDKELVDLREKEDELRADADRLKDPDYIARYAREKYLYSKDGEFIIKIPEESK